MNTHNFDIASFESQMMCEALRLCAEARLDFNIAFDESNKGFTIQAGHLLVSPVYSIHEDQAESSEGLSAPCPDSLVWAVMAFKFPEDAEKGDEFECDLEEGDVLNDAYDILHTTDITCLSEALSVLCDVIMANVEAKAASDAN